MAPKQFTPIEKEIILGDITHICLSLNEVENAKKNKYFLKKNIFCISKMDTVANAVAQGHHHGMAVADAKRKRAVRRPKKMVKGSAATKRYMAYLRSLKKGGSKKKSTKKKKSVKKRPSKTPKRKPCKAGKVRRRGPSGKVRCMKKKSSKKKSTKKK